MASRQDLSAIQLERGIAIAAVAKITRVRIR